MHRPGADWDIAARTSLGLAFCMAGDILLGVDKVRGWGLSQPFQAGCVCFMLAHSMFLLAMHVRHSLLRLDAHNVVFIVFLIPMGMLLRLGEFDFGELAVGAWFYAFLILYVFIRAQFGAAEAFLEGPASTRLAPDMSRNQLAKEEAAQTLLCPEDDFMNRIEKLDRTVADNLEGVRMMFGDLEGMAWVREMVGESPEEAERNARLYNEAQLKKTGSQRPKRTPIHWPIELRPCHVRAAYDLLFAIGSTLFMVSDGILYVYTFWQHHPGGALETANILAYYGGQFFIALACRLEWWAAGVLPEAETKGRAKTLDPTEQGELGPSEAVGSVGRHENSADSGADQYGMSEGKS